jgi:hypothetical protein
MITEFFGMDEVLVWNSFEGKHVALIPFIAGILILAYYYLFQKGKEANSSQVATM